MGLDIPNPLKHLSKPEIYATIAGAVGIGGYFVYRHHSATGSWNPWSSGSSAASTSDITGTGVIPDPGSGLTTTGYGGSSATGSGYGQAPAVTGLDGSTNAAPGSAGSTVYTDNGAWAQAATAGLASIGYSATDVATALGLFLNGQQLTADQAKLVNAAIAEFNRPPQGNPQIILAPVTQPGNTGTGVSGPPSVSGGHVVSSDGNDAVVAWTGTNAVKYDTTITGPGKINGQKASVSQPQAVYSGLEPGHSYTVEVVPYNASGKSGPSGHIDLKTPPVPVAKKG